MSAKPDYALILSEEHGLRYLHFGTPWVQGAMRLSRPTELVLDYTQDMMASLLLRTGGGANPWPRRALHVGLGTASLAKFLQRHRPGCQQTIIEIDPRIVHLAAQSFRFRPKANIRIEIADGARWMAEHDADSETYDLIFIDGFDDDAKPGALNARRFYSHCRERLSDRGVLVVNLLRRKQGNQIGVERILAAFDNRVCALPETVDGNTIVFAAVGPVIELSRTALKQRAGRLKTATGLDLGGLLARMDDAERSGLIF